ncbi:MAG: family 43 glycosylhydrolase [Bacteroidota bacterium]
MMIMTSKDLVNWRMIGHAVADITQINPRNNYDRMEGASRGIWPGAIAYRHYRFYVYFTDPDFGIYMTSATNPAGPWKPLTQLLQAARWDDPSPLWDDNGKAWLVATNFADNYKIYLFAMTEAGTKLLKNKSIVIHQSKGSEANKIYKINHYYYHFYSEVTNDGRMPFMERSANIMGPYHEKKQLINPAEGEPNQGGLVQTEKGKWYFVTHHGKPYWDGLEVSVLPVTWCNAWPL